MCPELVKKMDYDGIAVDMWAMGVILYKMVTGDYPFGSEKDQFLNQRILACDLKMPNYVSAECRNLIMACLQSIPENRVSAAEMKLHPFCTGSKLIDCRIPSAEGFKSISDY
jgi:serine/threonine protein kinase